MKKLSFLTIGLILIFCGTASAAPVQWSENGHWYDVVEHPDGDWARWTWQEASDLASASEHQGMQGHLVTITSQEERNFITDTFHSVLRNGLFPKTIWLGGFQDTDAAGVLDGWNWVTGEAWGGYTEWASGQPNNLDQNYLAWAYLSTSPARGWHDTPVDYKFWADEPVAYIVEYEAVPVPASFLLLGAGLCVIARLKHE